MPGSAPQVMQGGRMRGSTLRRTAVAVALTTGVALGGCTSEGPEAERPASARATETATPTPEPEAAPDVATKARNGSVTGRIGRRDRKQVVARVASVVDRWLGKAYVDGDYPRRASSFGGRTWAGFTQGAAHTARGDKDLMSNADIAERIDGLEVRRREITVDVLAVDRTARAATARVRLAFKTHGDLERKVTVTGRVFLTRRNGTWKVFGYDVAKGRV
jgi:hypothetical protein